MNMDLNELINLLDDNQKSNYLKMKFLKASPHLQKWF